MSSAIVPYEKKFEAGLAKLKKEVETLVVKDEASYIECTQVLLAIRSHLKDIDDVYDPQLRTFREGEAKIRTQKAEHYAPAKEIEVLCQLKGSNYKAQERKATAVDEAKTNVKREKAGLPPVHVVPKVPKVSGIRGRINYSANLVNAPKFWEAFYRARGSRKEYLAQFVTIDMQAVNEEARRLKSKKNLEAMIPGIEGVETDRI